MLTKIKLVAILIDVNVILCSGRFGWPGNQERRLCCQESDGDNIGYMRYLLAIPSCRCCAKCSGIVLDSRDRADGLANCELIVRVILYDMTTVSEANETRIWFRETRQSTQWVRQGRVGCE